MIRILAVDDDLNMLHYVASELRLTGYQVIEATSGEQALDVLNIKPVDIAIVDVMMPGIDGQHSMRLPVAQKGAPKDSSFLFHDKNRCFHTFHNFMTDTAKNHLLQGV